METLVENIGLILDAAVKTLELLVVSGLFALVLGTILASMRVSPVPILRLVGTVYVAVFRNTPLLVLLILVVFGFPKLGLDMGFFAKNCLALGLYTSAFICEAVRSGVNSVPLGQAEAARSVGLGFGQTMTQVVLPQSFRAVVPPIASLLIALTKNSSLCSLFGILESTSRMKQMLNNHPDDLWWIFLGVAVVYIVIVELISAGGAYFERRWRVAL